MLSNAPQIIIRVSQSLDMRLESLFIPGDLDLMANAAYGILEGLSLVILVSISVWRHDRVQNIPVLSVETNPQSIAVLNQVP